MQQCKCPTYSPLFEPCPSDGARPRNNVLHDISQVPAFVFLAFSRHFVCVQVGCRPASGLRLWDIRFGGERIVYELALQEALVSLSGATPSQARSVPDS